MKLAPINRYGTQGTLKYTTLGLAKEYSQYRVQGINRIEVKTCASKYWIQHVHGTSPGNLDTEILDLEQFHSTSGYARNCVFSRKESQQHWFSAIWFLASVGRLLRFSSANIFKKKKHSVHTQWNLVLWEQTGQWHVHTGSKVMILMNHCLHSKPVLYC